MTKKPDPLPVLPETILLALVGGLDLIYTVYLIGTGQAREANPLLAAVLEHFGPPGFAFFKALLLAVPLGLAEVFRKRNPHFVRMALRTGLVLYLSFYVILYSWFNLIPHGS